MSSQNQEIPDGVVLLLNVDVWEHAYYLDYFNKRTSFLQEIWKIVNWQKVNERYEEAVGNKKHDL